MVSVDCHVTYIIYGIFSFCHDSSFYFLHFAIFSFPPISRMADWDHLKLTHLSCSTLVMLDKVIKG